MLNNNSMPKKITQSTKKQIYYKCMHCGDEIFWNTHKKLTWCKCEKTAVDGCEYYVRIIGNDGDYKMVLK